MIVGSRLGEFVSSHSHADFIGWLSQGEALADTSHRRRQSDCTSAVCNPDSGLLKYAVARDEANYAAIRTRTRNGDCAEQ
jgi:hypothetical protein